MLTSVPFRVKIHISSHCRREITVFFYFSVPDRREVELCFTEKLPLSCGWLWDTWMNCCLWRGFLIELCISWWCPWRIQQLKYGESPLFCPTVILSDDIVQSCFFSSPLRGRCFNLCHSRAHYKCMKWIKISYERRESLKCCSCKQADPVKRWTPGCRRSWI